MRSLLVAASLALVCACAKFEAAPEPSDGGIASDSGGPEGGTAVGPITVIGVSSSPLSASDQTTLTFAGIPSVVAGDLLLAFVMWTTATPSGPMTAPSGWTSKASIDDSFRSYAASFYRIVPPGTPAADYTFPLPVAARATGVLIAYRGVFAPPQHVVVDRAQNLTTNEGSIVVPGLSAAEQGRLLLVVASTYDDRKAPLRVEPAIAPIVDLGRIAAFDRDVGAGPTGDFALTDGFFALRATLTFATVLRNAR